MTPTRTSCDPASDVAPESAVQGKKPLTKRTAAKIDHLERLISHPATSDVERTAGRRALARIAESYELHAVALGDRHPARLYNPGSWVGEKFQDVARLPLTDIAKRIRADIRLARKVGRATAPKNGEIAVSDPIGDAPRQVKFSVRTEYYSGGGSIDVLIYNIPEDWGYARSRDDWGNPVQTATPAMAALFHEVKRIHWTYNYDNSDAQTDFFDRRYWVGSRRIRTSSFLAADAQFGNRAGARTPARRSRGRRPARPMSRCRATRVHSSSPART